MQKTIWLSFDLGIRGDYEGIYTWLDDHQAKECGDNIAVLKYDFSVALLDDLKSDISRSIELTKKSRIYVIWRDDTTKKMKGRFICGTRKSPPWTGYANGDEVVEDEGV